MTTPLIKALPLRIADTLASRGYLPTPPPMTAIELIEACLRVPIQAEPLARRLHEVHVGLTAQFLPQLVGTQPAWVDLPESHRRHWIATCALLLQELQP